MKKFLSFLLSFFSKNSNDSQLQQVHEPTIRELEMIQQDEYDLSDNAYFALCEEILKNENISIQEYDFLTGETESYSF